MKRWSLKIRTMQYVLPVKNRRISQRLHGSSVYFSTGNNGAHEWMIEFEKAPLSLEYFTDVLDTVLKSLNSDYETKRYKDMPWVFRLSDKSHREHFMPGWNRKANWEDKHKVPRLCNDREFMDEISSIAPNESLLIQWRSFFCFFTFFFISVAFSLRLCVVTSNSIQPWKAMTTDNLGNVFVIVENQLLEFDASGKPKANYSEKIWELRSVDAGNPMKIELFYPDFGRIVMLNSSLAVQSTINLRALGISQASLVCHSFVDGYWIFDLQDYQLKKVTLDLQNCLSKWRCT